MSGAVVSIACSCGRSMSAPCAAVGEIPSVAARFAGWGYDEHGIARCPDCYGGNAAEEVIGHADACQGDLFIGEAA